MVAVVGTVWRHFSKIFLCARKRVVAELLPDD
jgi:hypothetical protein